VGVDIPDGLTLGVGVSGTRAWNVPEENGFEVQHYHVFHVPASEREGSFDTTPCKVTPVILHEVVGIQPRVG